MKLGAEVAQAGKPSPLAFMRQYVRVVYRDEKGEKRTIWAQKLRLRNHDILYRVVAGGELDKLITIPLADIIEETAAIENASEDIYWWTVEEIRAECVRHGIPEKECQGLHKKALVELLAPGKGVNPPYAPTEGQVWDPIHHTWVERML